MNPIEPNRALLSTSTVTPSIAINPSTTMTAAATSSVPNFIKTQYVALWDTDGPGIDSWISTVASPFQNSVGRATSAKKDGTYLHSLEISHQPRR